MGFNPQPMESAKTRRQKQLEVGAEADSSVSAVGTAVEVEAYGLRLTHVVATR